MPRSAKRGQALQITLRSGGIVVHADGMLSESTPVLASP
jgi:hypothetical protein